MVSSYLSLLFVLICINNIANSLKCLDHDGRIGMSDFSAALPHCWPLNQTSTSCNWCSNECFPVPDESDLFFCRKDETCCQHECGTFCVQRLLTSAPAVKACLDPSPRIACPPLESFPKCASCEDRCRTDFDCNSIGGGGRICCPTRCGRRCHETLIF